MTLYPSMCGLCGSPKFEIRHRLPTGIFLCQHCDTVVGCKGSLRCGACKLLNSKVYPGLPNTPTIGGGQ